MKLFDHIIQANAESSDIQGIMYGIVADIKDPLKLQRVQVYDQSKGGEYKSDWLMRGLPFTSFSPPMPKVGDLVIFGYIMGDPHHGCYLGVVVNNVNKPVGDDKDFTIVLGGATVSIKASTGDVKVETTGKVDVKGKTVTIEATEQLKFLSPKVVYDSPDVDLGAPTSVKISGKQVVTLTATDNRGDTLVSKGW
jgi:hypothetical protein